MMSYLYHTKPQTASKLNLKQLEICYEKITYNIGINNPTNKYHFPFPTIPFFPLTIKSPEIAKNTSENAKKSPIGLHPFIRLE